jgi:hypothetical protein
MGAVTVGSSAPFLVRLLPRLSDGVLDPDEDAAAEEEDVEHRSTTSGEDAAGSFVFIFFPGDD